MDPKFGIALIWLVFLVVCIIAELASQGLTTIWLGGGALFALIIALCGGPIWLQVTIFVIVTAVLLIVTRPLALKYYNNKLTKTNSEELIGKTAVVTETIDNVKETGTVRINGLDWTARTEDGSVVEKDTTVTIQKIEGVKLIVKVQ